LLVDKVARRSAPRPSCTSSESLTSFEARGLVHPVARARRCLLIHWVSWLVRLVAESCTSMLVTREHHRS
jgi:hypothetical protein